MVVKRLNFEYSLDFRQKKTDQKGVMFVNPAATKWDACFVAIATTMLQNRRYCNNFFFCVNFRLVSENKEYSMQ